MQSAAEAAQESVDRHSPALKKVGDPFHNAMTLHAACWDTMCFDIDDIDDERCQSLAKDVFLTIQLVEETPLWSQNWKDWNQYVVGWSEDFHERKLAVRVRRATPEPDLDATMTAESPSASTGVESTPVAVEVASTSSAAEVASPVAQRTEASLSTPPLTETKMESKREAVVANREGVPLGKMTRWREW